MKRRFPLVEALEPRTLLSSLFFGWGFPGNFDFGGRGLIIAIGTHPSVPSPRKGDTLHVTANTPFSGEVAFFPSPLLNSPLQNSATINWGDGNSTKATLQYVSNANRSGYEIDGSHTYTQPGVYKIKTRFESGPLPTPGSPSPESATRVTTFVGKAIVTAASSSGAVTLSEIAGRSFTATLGSFTVVLPATRFKARIDWGDGATSQGSLRPDGVHGIDLLQLNIVGTHTYFGVGSYSIHITVTPARASTPSLALDDLATVVPSHPLSLAGTLAGTYRQAPTAADTGPLYEFTGSGTAGDLGPVTVTGNVQLPGFVLNGHATGTLVLTNFDGAVTLVLTGPAGSGFGPFPPLLSFVVSSGTGAYANANGRGTIAATLTPAVIAGDSNPFLFVLTDEA